MSVRARFLLLFLPWMLLGPGVAEAQPQAKPQPRARWNPEPLTVTLFPGTAVPAPLTLTTTGNVEKASLFITPSLSGYLSIDTSGFTTVPAGAPIEFVALFRAPSNAPLGTRHGTIHLRSGSRTVPDVLSVVVRVVEPSPLDIPTSPAIASPDRIVLDEDGQKVIRDELVVILDPETPDPLAAIRDIALATGGKIIGSVPETFTFQLRYPGADLAAVLAKQSAVLAFPGVIAASRSFLTDALSAIPNDTEYKDAWNEAAPGGDNYGLELVKAPSAWDLTTGSSSVAIGILDGDFDAKHGDLDGNILSNVGSRTTSFNGHGTHVAGIAGAEGNNAQGVTGMSWDPSLRLYDFSSGFVGGTSAIRAQAAMVQAVKNGVAIVNMSLQWIDNNQCGTPGTAATLKKVDENNDILAQGILYGLRQDQEILWVFAAGNECRDAKYASPASLVDRFPLNSITVASVRSGAGLSGFSNFGDLITVAAPGSDILSTIPRTCLIFGLFCTDRYGKKSGTSMAAPLVSGLAALILSKHPGFTAEEVKKCIVGAAKAHGTAVPGHAFKVVNAPKAIECKATLDLPPKVDIVLSLDLTGSMFEEIDRVKTEAGTIIGALEAAAPATDFRFGIVSYEDYAGYFDSTACGSSYATTYGEDGTKPGGDAPFRIDLPLTGSAAAVIAGLDALVLGYGGDGPQSYGRVYWEVAQADTGAALGFRSDALKLLIDFGDNIPHDPDLNEGIFLPPFASLDAGVDPGRNDNVDCGGDDIDFQEDALEAMASQDVRLVHIDSSGDPNLIPYWLDWTSQTGGAFAAINSDGSVPTGTDLAGLIISLLQLIPD